MIEKVIALELKYPPSIPNKDIKILKYPKVVQLPVISTSQPKKNEPGNLSLNCMYCSKKFKTCASKRRHELHRCPKKDEFMVPKVVEKQVTDTNKEVIEGFTAC